MKEKIGFAISVDMTKELRACCTTVASERWALLDTREREQVDLAEVEFAVHQSQLSVRVPVAEQRLQEIVDARGRLLAMYDARRSG